MTKKHGVLVLQGLDHRRQFSTALDLLLQPPATTDIHPNQFVPADIDVVWVRKFGPLGVIQLRFSTSDATLAYLRSRAACLRVDAALRRANPTLYAAPEMPPPLLVVNEAAEPAQEDATIEHQVWCGECRVLPGAEGDDHRLRKFAAMLASLPGVELAQYDSTRSGQRTLFQMLRLFDHQRRGPQWLEAQVRAAMKLVHEKADYQFDLSPQDQRDREGARHSRIPLESYLNKMLRHDAPDAHDPRARSARDAPRAQERYVYMLVHCSDHQGLFADLSAVFESAPGTARRNIVLGAARGMGQQGIVMFAAPGTDTDAAVLNARVREFMRNRRRVATPYARAFSDRRAHVYDALVIDSPERPGLRPTPQMDQGYVTLEATHPNDGPGLLSDLCARVLKYGGDEANFYLVDGRSRSSRGSKSRHFEIGMGVLVPGDRVEPLKLHLTEVLETPKFGWQDVEVHGERF